MTSPALRLAFAGTPDFAAGHLEGLLAQGFNVVAVFSQPDRPAGRGKKLQPTPVKQLASRHDIPVYQPPGFDTADIENLAALAPDVLVVVAYGMILKPEILAIPTYGCLNVHASLLPRWRGAAPIERAILAGDRETGVSIMQMDAGLDTGDVLLRLPVAITHDDNAATVSANLLQLGCQGLGRVLSDLPAWQSRAEKQDDSLSTYAPKLIKAEAEIDWHRPALDIQHQVQAFYPRSPAWCHFNNDRLRIITARRVPGPDDNNPGTILTTSANAIQVGCGQDNLEITRVQLPGKKAAGLKDLFNGHPGLFAPGMSLEPL